VCAQVVLDIYHQRLFLNEQISIIDDIYKKKSTKVTLLQVILTVLSLVILKNDPFVEKYSEITNQL
jgi:hypothetical protein